MRLADPGGGYGYRASRIAVFALIGAGLTALGFGIGGDAWGWLVLAAFAVTLVAGLAAAFGVHRFVTALLLNLWFIVVLGVAASFHHDVHITSYTVGSGARLGRGDGAVDRGDIHRVADPRAPGPAPAGRGAAR